MIKRCRDAATLHAQAQQGNGKKDLGPTIEIPTMFALAHLTCCMRSANWVAYSDASYVVCGASE